MGKYFGTDGFRGEANVKLTAELAYKTGRYLGWHYKNIGKNDGRCRVLIGEDTRRSCIMLEQALAAGITASGADVYLMHVTTTPSVSYITRTEGFDCAVMISASHNPYYDNGLKVINGDGSKLGDAAIAEIEEYLDGKTGELPYALRGEIGIVRDYSEGRKKYQDFLISTVANAENKPFTGRTVALDTANGAASALAAPVFEALGAKVFITADKPDGFNINDGVGSTHIEALQKHVKETGAEIGFAYDGDADRCLAADEKGNAVNGDQLMYAAGLALKKAGKLKDDMVVVTVMSNFGLFRAFEREGIRYEKTKVGDRFVWECMSANGYSIGGEQSGHIIFSDFATTGDGILTSLKLTEVLIASEGRASELFAGCPMYPQCLKNVRVNDKKAAAEHPLVQKAVEEVGKELGDTGRILLRESGTEPVIRVMVEASTQERCEELVDRVIEVMKSAGVAAEA